MKRGKWQLAVISLPSTGEPRVFPCRNPLAARSAVYKAAQSLRTIVAVSVRKDALEVRYIRRFPDRAGEL